MSKSKKSFSLTEVIVASVILSIAMVGITNLFLSSKKYFQHSRCYAQATNLIRFFLDEFVMAVRADQFRGGDYISSNPLNLGNHSLATIRLGLPYINYFPQYRVSEVENEVRKVKFTIRWWESPFYAG
ncbi:MAG: prepilin-type N-terminal cleavage/methylation domain-containing protein [Candidatus Omnitrophica bacterium]|nr:prepilin-type N-terminal cleavage/methylation domain-containing protein [Candidatus Omnitrophota bacterium]